MKKNNKTPKTVKYFEMEELENKGIEQDKVDSLQFMSMIFGVISFIFKYKFSVWMSLTFFLANYFDQPYNVSHSKFIMNFGLIMMSFCLLYVFPS